MEFIYENGNADIPDLLREAEMNVIEEQEIQRISDDGLITPTMKESLINARRGQGIFRDRLEDIESGCRVTEVIDRRFLIASHIKPWRYSSDEERLDGNNGLLLSPHIDKLFDRFYISFTDDGDIIVIQDASRDVLRKWGVERCKIIKPFNTKQRSYLAYHRACALKAKK